MDVTLKLMIGSGQVSNSSEIPCPLICRFQEDPIKTECIMLMTNSNRGIFSNQEGVTLRLMIRSSQLLNSSENSIHVHFIFKIQDDLTKPE